MQMKKNITVTFIFCYLLLACFNLRAYSTEPTCDCFNDEMRNIRCYIFDYEEAARKKYLYEIPPFRERWDAKYRNRISALPSRSSSWRYPDVYQNMIVHEKRIGIVADYQYENAYVFYTSCWGNTKAQNEQKIAADRAKYAERLMCCKEILEDCKTKITLAYIAGFEKCLQKHSNLIVLHDYGMLAYLNNNFDKALELLHQCVDTAESTNELHKLDSKFCHDLGSVCFEVMQYDKAVKYLSDAIEKDPNDKKAYFDRALAYFECGNFEEAIQDYIASDQKAPVTDSSLLPSTEFCEALLDGLYRGTIDAAVDFVPSLCNTAYGLGKTLWATAEHPVESTKHFIEACNDIGEDIFDYCKGIDWNTVDDYYEQMMSIHENYSILSDAEKGSLIGYTISTYGLDFFAGGATLKGVAALRELKNANRICNFESMLLSPANKEAILASSAKHAADRDLFFKNVKIEWDKQNKHVIGKHNYEDGRSIFEHKNPENLLNKYAGTGTPKRGSVGEPGYQEIVNFEEHIGTWKSLNGLESLPTTKGNIHYSKHGAHIVPMHPETQW